MRRRRRRDGFYPAPDFRDREAEDMAGVFDIDLDQPEDAGSEDELEEGRCRCCYSHQEFYFGSKGALLHLPGFVCLLFFFFFKQKPPSV
uniref:Ribosomal protein S6 kinase B1 n=1 Tax=Sus scrofa TaxID=9823 RepID=A0A8D0RVE1_PIG